MGQSQWGFFQGQAPCALTVAVIEHFCELWLEKESKIFSARKSLFNFVNEQCFFSDALKRHTKSPLSVDEKQNLDESTLYGKNLNSVRSSQHSPQIKSLEKTDSSFQQIQVRQRDKNRSTQRQDAEKIHKCSHTRRDWRVEIYLRRVSGGP